MLEIGKTLKKQLRVSSAMHVNERRSLVKKRRKNYQQWASKQNFSSKFILRTETVNSHLIAGIKSRSPMSTYCTQALWGMLCALQHIFQIEGAVLQARSNTHCETSEVILGL